MKDHLYTKLKNQYTEETLAAAFVFPQELSKQAQAEAYQELKMARHRLLEEMSEQDRIFADLMRLKFRMEDL